MTLTELEYLVKEATGKYGSHVGEDDLPEQLTLVEAGDWIDDGKYQYCSDVYADDQTPPNHFMIHNERSGSYYSDYSYGDAHVKQVEPKVETITRVVWKVI